MTRKNIPNLLSEFRIACFPVFLYLVWKNDRQSFKVLFPIALSTDILDGVFARAWDAETKQGPALDSHGDMLTLVAGVFALFKFEKEFCKRNKNLIIFLVSLYLLQLAIANIKYGKATSFHTIMAKITALLEGVFLAHGIMYRPSDKLFKISSIFGILETIEETAMVFLLKEPKDNINGLYEILRKNK